MPASIQMNWLALTRLNPHSVSMLIVPSLTYMISHREWLWLMTSGVDSIIFARS